MDTAQKSAL